MYFLIVQLRPGKFGFYRYFACINMRSIHAFQLDSPIFSAHHCSHIVKHHQPHSVHYNHYYEKCKRRRDLWPKAVFTTFKGTSTPCFMINHYMVYDDCELKTWKRCCTWMRHGEIILCQITWAFPAELMDFLGILREGKLISEFHRKLVLLSAVMTLEYQQLLSMSMMLLWRFTCLRTRFVNSIEWFITNILITNCHLPWKFEKTAI